MRSRLPDVGQVVNLRPIVNRPRRILNELPDLSTLPSSALETQPQTTKPDRPRHPGNQFQNQAAYNSRIATFDSDFDRIPGIRRMKLR
jgi:hypothetical protein